MAGIPNIPKAPTLNQNINAPGSAESRSESFRNSVAASHQVRAVAGTVLETREDLVKFLKSNGLDLRTKFKQFQETKDFITSSYVIYPNHKNHQEPLGSFIERYPQIKPFVLEINQKLKQ